MLPELLVAAFDFYEDIVEALFENATAMLVHLECKNGVINMRLQIGCSQKISKHILDCLSIHYGEYRWKIHDEDITVALLISQGGDMTC